MHTKTAFKKLLQIDKITIEDVYFETQKEEIFIIKIRSTNRERSRCPKCGKRCSYYDNGDGLRRWRSLDFGSTQVYLEAAAPRVKCPTHGIIVERVPWARHNSGYTYNFESAVTWLALHATAKDVSEFFRVTWRSVGNIIKIVGDALGVNDLSRFNNLEEIGIDETSYKKGHKYMTVVIDHKTGDLIWAKRVTEKKC